MRIIDLTAEYEQTFLACIKDWERDAEGACHKARWCDMMKCKGLRVKLAADEGEWAIGMIQSLPKSRAVPGFRFSTAFLPPVGMRVIWLTRRSIGSVGI
jgi:hypothetical protein